MAACYYMLQTAAQDGSLTEILANTGIVPAGTEDVVAQYVLGAANTTTAEIEPLLAAPGIPRLEREDPQAYYAGQSPAVYPSRMSLQVSK